WKIAIKGKRGGEHVHREFRVIAKHHLRVVKERLLLRRDLMWRGRLVRDASVRLHGVHALQQGRFDVHPNVNRQPLSIHVAAIKSRKLSNATWSKPCTYFCMASVSTG